MFITYTTVLYRSC